MSKNADGERRVSVEQRRIFRTARLEFVPIGRIAGMEPAAAELLREWDLAPTGLLQCQDWTESGLHALMLVRPLVVVGSADGAGALHWLANGEVLLAMQGRWPNDTKIPALVLAHQITRQTRLQAVGAGILAVCAPALGRHLAPETLYRIWLRLLDAKLNPLTASGKMGFARTMGCDSRRLPAGRLDEATSAEEA